MSNDVHYGTRGQTWHTAFIEYMNFIAHHEHYQGMPDAFVDGGKIQWETPSNRTSGRYKDSHQKRLKWWEKKARELNIDPTSSKWRSRVAKFIHPTKQKPCKRCGRVLQLRFVYPSEILLKRIRKLSYLDGKFSFEEFEPIISLISRLHNLYSDRMFADLPTLLATSNSAVPTLQENLDIWLTWIETEYVPREPRTLSPGAMANPPDRFDGFHSFNECCRGVADTGRHMSNLRAYITDRRVFEYWVEGDWIAADRLYGELRKRATKETCLNLVREIDDETQHAGPCHIDHIGPISLGFTHRPEFQFLCGSCNSAKNNRMLLSDVLHLLEMEQKGDHVVSWYARKVWDAHKHDVTNRETAERLSKLMRDNRHAFMSIMRHIADAGHLTFLVSLINLGSADYNVRFVNLQIEGHRSSFDHMRLTRRSNRYATEQKVRHVRVALKALHDYFQKPSRNTHVIQIPAIDTSVAQILAILQQSSAEVQAMDKELQDTVYNRTEDTSDERFRALITQLPAQPSDQFRQAKQEFMAAMNFIGEELGIRWSHERYVRETGDLDDEGDK